MGSNIDVQKKKREPKCIPLYDLELPEMLGTSITTTDADTI